MHIAITIWAITASWRTWNWERFHKFHATILYISVMNLLYILFTMGYPLWRMEPELGFPFLVIDMLYTFIIFPCTAILFLSHYPKSVKGQVYHYLKWILIYIIVEWIGSLFTRITYDNEWNLWWSLLFLVMMFPMFRLHYKKPLLAYLLTLIITTVILYHFKVPWNIPVEGYL